MGEPQSLVHGDHCDQRLCAARSRHCHGVVDCRGCLRGSELAINYHLGLDGCAGPPLARQRTAFADFQCVDGGVARGVALSDADALESKRNIIGFVCTDDEPRDHMF